MATIITLAEAQATLETLVGKLAPGEAVIILQDQQPVARLIGTPRAAVQHRQAGSCREMIVSIAEDFDATLEDFKT
jgi:antitoxin (DNA-binding transcriptional repressor) of toxin-antitoxin stability system